MQNMKLDRKGNVLTITVDLAQQLGPSKTGKTTLIASSGGNVAIPGAEQFKLGLNIYTAR